jgi:ketosteroid isomerase-like protein
MTIHMKRISIQLTFVVFLAMSLTSCQVKTDTKVDTKAEAEKLMQISRDWSKAAVSRNLEETLKYWADDAVIISAGEPDLKGKDAIRKMVEGGFNDPGFEISWEPLSAEVSQSGDLGYLLEESKITLKDSLGNVQSQQFKSVTIWKKDAQGTWKNVVDVMSPK